MMVKFKYDINSEKLVNMLKSMLNRECYWQLITYESSENNNNEQVSGVLLMFFFFKTIWCHKQSDVIKLVLSIDLLQIAFWKYMPQWENP